MTDNIDLMNNHECNSPSMVEADQINRDNTIGKDANNQQIADIRALYGDRNGGTGQCGRSRQ